MSLSQVRNKDPNNALRQCKTEERLLLHSVSNVWYLVISLVPNTFIYCLSFIMSPIECGGIYCDFLFYTSLISMRADEHLFKVLLAGFVHHF